MGIDYRQLNLEQKLELMKAEARKARRAVRRAPARHCLAVEARADLLAGVVKSLQSFIRLREQVVRVELGS